VIAGQLKTRKKKIFIAPRNRGVRDGEREENRGLTSSAMEQQIFTFTRKKEIEGKERKSKGAAYV